MSSEHFADRLLRRIADSSPVVVGIDPRIDRLPLSIRSAYRLDVAPDIEAIADAFEEFGRSVVDAVSETACALKLQIAFFERFGWHGVRAYQRLCRYASQAGLVVIGDVKRGDIGSTAEAYADHLDSTESDAPRAPWSHDAVTLNPYLGYDSVAPFVLRCTQHGKGIFVLVRTSNPGASDFQDLQVHGEPAYVAVARRLHEWGLPFIGESGYSFVGAVVGGTAPDALAVLRQIMPRAVFLVPGYGAQGAGADAVVHAFDAEGRGAVVNASRSIIFAFDDEPYASKFSPDEWPRAVTEAARAMADDLAEAIRNRTT